MIIKGSYVETTKYGGAALDEYKGAYKLIKAYETDEGKVYAEWAFPQDKDRKPRKPALPVGVSLGTDEDKIIKLFEYYIKIFKGEADGELEPDDSFPDEDAPDDDPDDDSDVVGKVTEWNGSEDSEIPF